MRLRFAVHVHVCYLSHMISLSLITLLLVCLYTRYGLLLRRRLICNGEPRGMTST